MNCKSCGQPLVEIDFNSQYFRIVCDNWRCKLYKESQGCVEKKHTEELEAEPKKRIVIPHTMRTNYEPWLAEKRENYRELRKAGVPSKEAARMCSRKQTRAFLGELKGAVA